SERDTALTMASVRNTVRTLRNETTDLVLRMEAENPDIRIEDLLPHVSGKIGRQAYETGDTSKGLLSAGHALGFLHEVAPMAEIVKQLEREAVEAQNRLASVISDH
ncbi:MAG: nitronate monooxygenase, partial [Pseudomonadota bacterium]